MALTANKSLRERMRELNVPVWQLAKALGISENTALRRLREELPADITQLYLEIIETVAVQREGNSND